MDTADDIDQLYGAHLARNGDISARALSASGAAALVVGAGLPHYRFLDDQPDPFVVNPHFKAWVPVLDAPGSFLIYVPGAKPVLLFHQPEDYWHKTPELPNAAWAESIDIRMIRAPEDARAHVPANSAFVGEPFAGSAGWGFASVNAAALLDHLHFARAVKSPYEVACMTRASLAAARAHVAAAAAFRSGASEYDIHLAYLEAAAHQETELPYPNIIALNEHAATLHYHDLERRAPAAARSFLIDAGAQFRGYAADVTRTYAAASSPFADLVAGVDALQQRLAAMVVPGAAFLELHLAAHRLIGQLLAELGIVRCSAEAAVERGLTRVFFPHGLGHLLGLQVHDVGGHQASERGDQQAPPADHPYLRLTRRLDAGTVVTIEPGVYFIDLLLAKARTDDRARDIDWDTVADFRPYGGVRIEDNVVASVAGPQNLTRAAFATLHAAHNGGRRFS